MKYVLKKEHLTPEIMTHADAMMYAWIPGVIYLYNREDGLWREYTIHNKSSIPSAFNPLNNNNLIKDPVPYNPIKSSEEICTFVKGLELVSVVYVLVVMKENLGLKVLDDGSVTVEFNTADIVSWNEVDDDENPFANIPDIKDIPLKESERPNNDDPSDDAEPNPDETGESDARLDKIYSDAEHYVHQVMADAKKAADDWKEAYTTEKEEKVIDKTSLVVGIVFGAVGITLISKALNKIMD